LQGLVFRDHACGDYNRVVPRMRAHRRFRVPWPKRPSICAD
jgi:hypothetical protein